VTSQGRVDTLLQRLVAEGREIGIQVAAYVEQELVIDSWAGLADPETGREVDGDTLFHVFSAGKGVTATAVHVLAERGVLAYDDLISQYWPEFAANGKERVTVRHALTHSAGIPKLPEATSLRDLCNWDQMCETVAALSPIWEPGTKSGYHGLTFGYLLGEVVRRASGRGIDQIVRHEIAEPLGVEGSLALGITEAMRPRMAVHSDEGVGVSASPLDIPLVTYPFPFSTGANDPLFLASCVPAGATASARGLARMYALLANGGELGGVTLMGPKRVETIATAFFDGIDQSFRLPIRRGLGYVLGEPGTPMGGGGSFGHKGSGGSLGFADPQRRFALALTKSNLVQTSTADTTATTIVDEVRAALGLPSPDAPR
jgi:CubicO group peptidase (beta-lactamase class C family)